MQVLDDSDQEDVQQLIQEEVDAWRGIGAPIFYLHRTVRTGHKAGNLQNGMEDASAKDCEFVAILDADFVPASDYLRKTVPQFEGQPKLALVQVRRGTPGVSPLASLIALTPLRGLTVAYGSASALTWSYPFFSSWTVSASWCKTGCCAEHWHRHDPPHSSNACPIGPCIGRCFKSSKIKLGLGAKRFASHML